MEYLNELKNILLNPAVLTLITGIVLAAITWLLNERGKRKHNDYVRKEESYKKLLGSLVGFFENSNPNNTALKEEFLRQVDLCWLYCPDNVIKKAYAFLNKVKTGANHSDRVKEKALKDLVFAIRQDILPRRFLIFKRTHLEAKDFEILTST